MILIDEQDKHFLLNYCWYTCKKVNTSYVCRMSKRKVIYLHREILQANKNQLVDHINGNGLDNRRENLRFATKSTNAMNKPKRHGISTPYKGVYLSKEKGRIKKYQAYININKKRINLGRFLTGEDAALAYNNAALKYHGEYARLNII